jgi:L-serine dehydratase
MAISAFDLFKIGIGPSSSHTVGPMRAARRFTERLSQHGLLERCARLQVGLYGSLGATGLGHATDHAVLLGLSGHDPESVDVDAIPAIIKGIREAHQLSLSAQHALAFDADADLVFHSHEALPFHPNGMRFSAFEQTGALLDAQAYYSVGGGFVVNEQLANDHHRQHLVAPDAAVLPLPFHSADELLMLARRERLSIAQIMRRNEAHWRSNEATDQGLLRIWQAMQACVQRGCATEGILPGGFKVRRRAPQLHRQLTEQADAAKLDPLQALDWVNLWALAVNEENAAGGRVVTAPTNGAAGIVPAVLHHYRHTMPGANDQGVFDFLLTAAAIGLLYKENASISGAEIGMEHHLGLTCDPVGGLVQIPCIERNAIAAVKAINAARMAMRGNGTHHVSLDQVIKTMRETGADMMSKYKETARGGLAVNIVAC